MATSGRLLAKRWAPGSGLLETCSTTSPSDIESPPSTHYATKGRPTETGTAGGKIVAATGPTSALMR